MTWSYSCPFCRSVVNPDETVILLAVHDDRQVLMGFHPQPGNYTIYLPPGVEIRPGEEWNFYCPVCRQNLAAEENPDLCALDVRQGENRRRVLFSRIAGERATYIVNDTRVEERHGDHANHYESQKTPQKTHPPFARIVPKKS